ncbi:MAG: hypothetical protein ACRDKH_07095, partial [Solirubrobacterales bacterium]
PTPPGPGPGPGPGSGSGSGPSAPDSAPPGLELELLKGRRAARSREVVIRAGCAEACMVEASTEFLLPGRNFDGGPERVSLAAGLPERLVLPLSRRQARRLRAVLRRGGKAKAIVEAVATDLAANTDRARLRLKQKR